MSKLAEYLQLEKNLAEQLQALEALKSDGALKKEIEFETKLRELLAQYRFSLKHIVNLLDPQSSVRGQAPVQTRGTRKPRKLKTYKNPHTGEMVETKGGNHKTLKVWKTEHGSDVVESWLKK
ncbi:histone-like nucleoid-structuring protein, MvaT/MvaU family [Pseudomonas simiae]|uniref:Transcriptional regulator n=1 Tax=Pseudomonas simiae TaxID=321846 RepID=A0ABS9FX61_9PSED|nr:histone-like nucleoid-structuring protein, MvaT/MvaU family [Pseudomonas simiae]MCF5185731.1 transcriptional regulator [Pseudomonas simiae]MCF5289259.1 transcriptional regulator [Pseudomonas simiae]MCF5316982.1 transcriptional regulator [Pseudomonas simiae]MCF5335650.1 transcriptional regulator [Pseudomonas simiae]MCF5343237.1 transcriptional regulator [Pseudomonas simiae]